MIRSVTFRLCWILWFICEIFMLGKRGVTVSVLSDTKSTHNILQPCIARHLSPSPNTSHCHSALHCYGRQRPSYSLWGFLRRRPHQPTTNNVPYSILPFIYWRCWWCPWNGMVENSRTPGVIAIFGCQIINWIWTFQSLISLFFFGER